MVIAIISELIFNEQPTTHTVQYANDNSKLAFLNGREKLGTFKAVIANDEADAVVKLRKQLQEYLSRCWQHPKLKDFEFRINYTEVKNDEFWLIPNTSSCTKYPIESTKE